MIKQIGGMMWAADILYGKKPIPTYKYRHHDNGEFKKLLDAEMTRNKNMSSNETHTPKT